MLKVCEIRREIEMTAVTLSAYPKDLSLCSFKGVMLRAIKTADYFHSR